jgi:fructose-specific phosphotransferase system IIC component
MKDEWVPLPPLWALIGITEGAIPFAVKNLKTVLPSIIIGSAVGAGLAMVHGVESMVPRWINCHRWRQ